MKKIIPIYILLVLFALTSKAQQQVSISTAKIAAINTMRYNRQIYTEADIDTVNLYVSGLDTLLYEVKFNDNHSVLLSGSLACQPVLGYNFSYDDETALDHFDEIPPGFQSMIQEYIDQIELCFANDTITLGHEKDWGQLMSYNKNGNEVYDVVEPLITTRWGQGESNFCEFNGYIEHVAYNYYVSETSLACGLILNNCPTGCVATAMAQIMNYWKHPVYNPDLEANQFDWCNMPDDLCRNSPNYINERNAIAWLMRQCGIKSNMNYCDGGECQSGTSITDARNALVDSLQYSNSATIYYKSQCLPLTWIMLIINNLEAGKPVLYAGNNSSNTAGHVFVCDGYRSDNTFHFNWGWNGLYLDYWFNLNSLSIGSTNFSSYQLAIFNITPVNILDYCSFSVSLEDYFSTSSGSQSIAVPKTFSVLQSVNRNSGLNAMYRTIPDGASIEYVAHKKVILVDGFHAEEGSHFSAYIDECEKCEEEDLRENHNGDKKSFEQSEPVMTASNIADKVYIIPNPNQGSFYVSLSNNEDEITGIRVFDTMGKIIYSNNRFNGGEIVLPNAKQGLYYVVVTLKDKTITEKIIIQ